MQLTSLDHILEGVGKLRAASVVAAAGSAAAFLGLHLGPGVQEAGLTATAVVISVVNVVDGYVRGQHVSALPKLIEQGAETVGKTVSDPRVDSLAQSVERLATRATMLEEAPKAPTLPEIIAGLTGKDDTAAATPAPAGGSTVVDPLAPVHVAP